VERTTLTIVITTRYHQRLGKLILVAPLKDAIDHMKPEVYANFIMFEKRNMELRNNPLELPPMMFDFGPK